MIEKRAGAGLTSHDVTTEAEGVLKRRGLADLRAGGERLEMGGEQRCGQCIKHGIYPKRLIATFTIDSEHAGQGLPDMVLKSPDLPAATCEHCDRTYFIEPEPEDETT